MTVDFQSLMAIDPQCTIQYHEPLKNHTTFKIGGAADILVIPGSVEGIAAAIKLCRQWLQCARHGQRLSRRSHKSIGAI
jgi:UDP-N-acetylmuramate dehydrogenase